MIKEFLNPNEVELKPVERNVVSDFVQKHYLGSYPAAAKLYLGIYYSNNLVGMIIYGSPIGPQTVNAIFKPESNLKHNNVLELKRLYLVDDEGLLPKDAKKNLAGYSISQGNLIVANTFPDVKAIVTYSDSSVHSGAVYKATNAVYQGEYNNKKRWVYLLGSKTQKKWLINHLKQNLDWKNTNEGLDILEKMWKDVGVI